MKSKFNKVVTLSTIVVGLVLSLSACSPASSSMTRDFAPMPQIEMQSEYSAADASALGGSPEFAQLPPTVTPSADEAIIRTGSASIRVKDPASAANEVTQIASGLGGSIENRSINQQGEGYGASADLLIKVPAKQFDAVYEKLAEVGTLTYDQRSDTDVTMQKTDLTARVAALETSVDRLFALLEKATATSDLVEIESALSERQQELDSLRAQLTMLQDQISYSRVWVHLTSDEVIPGGPTNFWDGIVAGFNGLLTAASAGLVWLGILTPWLIVAVAAGAIVWGIARGIRKRRKPANTKTQA